MCYLICLVAYVDYSTKHNVRSRQNVFLNE